MHSDWQLKLRWNLAVFNWVYDHRHPALDAWYRFYFRLGKGYAVVAFLPLFLWLGNATAAIHMLVAGLCAGLAARAMKLTFQHKRPSKLIPGIEHRERLYSRSFPSGDAAFAFAVLGVGGVHLPTTAVLILGAYAVLIAYGRVYQGMHFPLDVSVGALVGLGMAAVSLDFSRYLGLFLSA